MESCKLKISKPRHQKQEMLNKNKHLLKQQHKSNKNHSLFCEPAVIQNNVIKSDQIGYKSGKEQESSQKMLVWNVVFLGIIISQFSIQTSVLLIQYIASKISLLIFLVFAIFLIVLTILILIPLRQIGFEPFYQRSQVKPQIRKGFPNVMNSAEIVHPTVLKIRNEVEGRNNQKTQKLKPHVCEEKKEKVQIKTRKNLKSSKSLNKNIADAGSNCFCKPLSIIIFSKFLQNIFAFVGATICFVTIQNPSSEGFSSVSVLLTILYVLVILSSVVLVAISIKNSKGIQLKQKESIQLKQVMPTLLEAIEPQKTNTVLSIEQYVHSNVIQNQGSAVSIKIIDKNNEEINGFETQKVKNVQYPRVIQKSQHVQQSQNGLIIEKLSINPQQVKPEVPVNDQLTLQKLTKKSVLKNTRGFKGKAECSKKEQIGDEQPMERRKVEINSKKIQFFQCSNISPANSSKGVEDQCIKLPNKAADKSKFAGPKSRYQKQRMILEAKILQHKREQNLKRNASKSTCQIMYKKETIMNKSCHFHQQESYS